MQHITVIRQLANEHLAHFNRMVRHGHASSVELQVEAALETLADVAHRLGANKLYSQIADRINTLHQRAVLAPVTAIGGDL